MAGDLGSLLSLEQEYVYQGPPPHAGETLQTAERHHRGPLGCTHLNDMLRSLADVPGLARQLPAASGS